MIDLITFEKWFFATGECHFLKFKNQYTAYATLGMNVNGLGDTEELAIINLYFTIINSEILYLRLTQTATYKSLVKK